MKPTVLQLIDSFHLGGSERQALQLTRLLHDSGRFRVRLASLSGEGVLRNEIADLDIGEIPVFPLNSFYDKNAFVQMKRLVSWLKAEKVDVLHTHDFYTNVFGMTAGKLASVPVRIASMRETAGMRSAAQQRVQRLIYSLADQVIANSNAVRDVLIAQGVSARKITVIYNGLDLSRVAGTAGRSRSEMLSRLGLPNEAIRLITIMANMNHDVKDHPMFLRMAQRVHQAIPDSAFVLAGEGILVDSLKSLAAELGLHERTFFIGRCADVADLLSVSELCVLTSKAEGFSNSILEYMAAARPVVATAVGGAPEAIAEGESGFLVASGDDEKMADHVILLLRNPEQAQAMGEQGSRIVKDKFSTQAQLENTEALYQTLLQTNSRSASHQELGEANSPAPKESVSPRVSKMI